ITGINMATRSNVLSIAVAQAAIAILVHPPHGCTVDVLTASEVEKAYRVEPVTWTDLHGSGTDCDTTVTPIARADSSGTPYQVKHWFTGVTTAALVGNETWGGNTTTTNSTFQSTNTAWPNTAVVKSNTGCLDTCPASGLGTGSGGGDLVKTVGVTPNSIGYAA